MSHPLKEKLVNLQWRLRIWNSVQTYCHTATYRKPASQEEKGKDGDDVGRDLKQSAGNQNSPIVILHKQDACKAEPDNDVEVQVARDEAAWVEGEPVVDKTVSEEEVVPAIA